MVIPSTWRRLVPAWGEKVGANGKEGLAKIHCMSVAQTKETYCSKPKSLDVLLLFLQKMIYPER